MTKINYNGKEVIIAPTTIITEQNNPSRSKQIFEPSKIDIPISVLFENLWDGNYKRRADIYYMTKYALKNLNQTDAFTADIGNGNILMFIGLEEIQAFRDYLATPPKGEFSLDPKEGGDENGKLKWLTRGL